MGILGRILSLLFGEKRLTLGDLTVTDLENEKIRFEIRQDRIIKEIGKLEERKRALFEEGSRKPSQAEKRAFAVQIKQLDEDVRDQAASQAVFARRIAVVGKLIRLKRREKMLRDEGLWGKIAQMDVEAAEDYIIEVRAMATQGDRSSKKLIELLDEGEEEAAAAVATAGDTEIDDIVKQMEAASYGGGGGRSAEAAAGEGEGRASESDERS